MLKAFGVYRGINLGGWLSQCDYSADRLNHFIKEEDFQRIASWPVDHVRIPVDYNVLEDDKGGYDAPGWERLDWALEQCEKLGLKVIIDLHKTAGFSFDAHHREEGFFESAAYQERFWKLWEEIAHRYGKLSDRVVFELLNEVTEERLSSVWNGIAAKAISRIRAIAPDTFLLVGSYHNNSAPAVKDLDAPADDHVIYNFHCYDPIEYTHQGAYWVDWMDTSARVSFDESGVTEETFEKLFAPALEKAKKHGASLYCGEYGGIDVVPPEDAVNWVRVINKVFEKYGIARAIWSYRAMDFGIADARWDAVRDDLIKVL